MTETAEFVQRLGGLGQAMGRWAQAVEPAEIDPAQLVAVVEQLERLGRQVAVIKARVAGDAVRRDAWRPSGARSAEAWYAKVTGTTQGVAARRLATQQRSADQPDVEAARRCGSLSDEQADRISEAAGDDVAAQAKLVHQAQTCSARQLREECDRTTAARRRAEDDERRRRQWHDSRSYRTWTDADGAGGHGGRMTPEALAEWRSHLAPFEQAEFDRARLEGRRESPNAYRADALLAMARAATAHATGSPTEGDTKVGAPVKAIVHVSHESLVRGHCEGGEFCHIEGVGAVPVAVATDMMGDAFLAAVVTDGNDIRSVVHLGRQVTAAQRTALEGRDRCCVVPGCGSADRLEIDHVTGWSPTRHTTIDELARLCARHHRLKTYHGWTLAGRPGHWTWTLPGESPPPAAPPQPPAGGGSEQGDLFAAAGPP